TMTARRGQTLVGAPLAPHRLRPAVGRAETRGEIGVLQHAAQNTAHVLIASGQERHVRHTETENGCHGLLLWEGNPSRVPLDPSDHSDVQSDAVVEFDALDREAAVLEQARQAGGADHVKDTDADEYAPAAGVQRLDARG